MDGQVEQVRVRPGGVHAIDQGLPGVRGSVVGGPERSIGRGAGFGGHNLVDEPAERRTPCLVLGPADYSGVVDVVGGDVGQRSAAGVFELPPAGRHRIRRAARDACGRGLGAGGVSSALAI